VIRPVKEVFDVAERAMLAYADKLTLTPTAMLLDDVQRLRDAGLDDRTIHDVCVIVAYVAFVTRIARRRRGRRTHS
jgi:alkylhydroperoxidase family enzyme